MAEPTTASELALMLDQLAHMTYKLTLGSVSPWMAAVGKRMREPVEGDLVMETSTYYQSRVWDQSRKAGHSRDFAPEKRIGRLVKLACEPVAIEWDEAEDGPMPTERVFYIVGLDGQEHRWTNATFIAIPDASWEDAVKPDEEAVRRFQKLASL